MWNREKVSSQFQIVVFTKDNLKMENLMEMENIFIKMAITTQENSIMECVKDKAV